MKRGRKTLLAKLQKHFGEKSIFPKLEEIVAKIESDDPVRVSAAAVAISEETKVSVGPATLRKMIKRTIKNGTGGRLPKNSVLREAMKIRRGAPKGSCLGMIRNPAGAAGKIGHPELFA